MSNKYRLTIPDSIDDITIRQYKDYSKELNAEATERENMDKILSIFCSGDIDKIHLFDASFIKENFSKLIQSINDAPKELIKFVTIDGVEYGFNPNLSEMTFGELSDLESYRGENITNNIEYVLAILYRKVTKKKLVKEGVYLYEIEPYDGAEERAKIFIDKFPLKAMHGATIFFCTLEKELLSNTMDYSKKKKKNMGLRLLLLLIGVGITLFIFLLKVMF